MSVRELLLLIELNRQRLEFAVREGRQELEGPILISLTHLYQSLTEAIKKEHLNKKAS